MMDHYVGLDVSVRETSVCVVDETGKLLKEAKVPTEPGSIASLLAKGGYVCKRVGLEAGPMSQWLYAELAAARLPVICVEAQHMRSALAAQRNKTDRNDARGIAQMMRVGLYRPVHVKTLQSQERRLLLTARKLLQAKLLDLEAELRGTLKNFGLRVGIVGKGGFRQRVRELIEGREALTAVMSALLEAHEALQNSIQHPAQAAAGPGARRSALPAADDGARHRAGDRVDVPGHGRRADPLSKIAVGGRAFRPDPEAVCLG